MLLIMAEKILLEKTAIRKQILKKSKCLADEKKEIAESKMLKHLKNWDLFEQAQSIHIFISKNNEPNTFQIIDFCWKLGKQISVPCVMTDTDDLFHSKLSSFRNLSKGPFGVLEPSHTERIESTPESFDIIIIPGVAFDRHGGRIGHGKGFYDKFLPQTKAYRLALAFDFQVLEKIPLEKHDESVHGILTESGIIMIDN